MVFLEWVDRVYYNPNNVSRETFSDIQSAKDFVFRKQKEMVDTHRTFLLLRFREV